MPQVTPNRPVVLDHAPDGVKIFLPAVVGNYVADPVTTKHYKEVRIHTYCVHNPDDGESVSAAVANIYLEQSIDGNGWKIMMTIVNPNESGEMYVLDRAPLTRVRCADWVSGQIISVLEEA